jgi:hypothetical protein
MVYFSNREMKAGSECFSSQGRRRTSAFMAGILPQAGYAPAPQLSNI